MEYCYCYLYQNGEDPKGWRSDGFRASWDCKSHWSFPMRGKLKRKIDKISVDASRELHRWATQLNVTPGPTTPPFQDVLTLVEYFIKSKSKQFPLPKSPFGALKGTDSQRPNPDSTPTSSTSSSSSITNGLLDFSTSRDLSHMLGLDAQPLEAYYDSAFRAYKQLRPGFPTQNDPWPAMGFDSRSTQMYQQPSGMAIGQFGLQSDLSTQHLILQQQLQPGFPQQQWSHHATVPQALLGVQPQQQTMPQQFQPNSVSPTDWSAWQQTLRSWAIYLEQLPPNQKAAVWSFCRLNPQFQAPDTESFIDLWNRWSQSFHSHAPSISAFCSALDNLRGLLADTGSSTSSSIPQISNLSSTTTTSQQPPGGSRTTPQGGLGIQPKVEPSSPSQPGLSEDNPLLEDQEKRAKMMNVASLVM